METVWFWLVGFMLATYVVLDGFDLGAGVLHLFVARNEEEREQILRAIGPVWDGNEVWLLASGGAIVLAFPALYAISFSGFYLPLMMVLWLFMGRALGIEMRHQVMDRLWKQFWDAIFAVSSFMLALFLGVALGNVIRGVPLSAKGKFFEPLWTDFLVGEQTGILDWYTTLVGLAAVAALTYHGALWLYWRTGPAVRQRVSKAIPFLLGMLLVLWVGTIAVSISVQPLLKEHLQARPWGAVFPILTFPAILASFYLHRRQKPGASFLASSLSLYAMICSAAAGLYPYVLPARNPEWGLTVSQVASSPQSLTLALFWWVPGMMLVGVYTFLVYRKLLPTRISMLQEGH
ncbi:MAG TPA: cytochrome d ubiquinol oxidase subunit II [Candidatus Binatia bacterium]|nr:cytochrome d ubiquinol oxidase subunit II [Candidatus Binatia bacterium]